MEALKASDMVGAASEWRARVEGWPCMAANSWGLLSRRSYLSALFSLHPRFLLAALTSCLASLPSPSSLRLPPSAQNEYMRLMAGKRHGKIDELLSQVGVLGAAA